MQLQHEVFERIMNSRKKIDGKVTPFRIEPASLAKSVALPLVFLEDDPVFSKYGSRFAAHLRFPFTHCRFTLQCKPRGKSPKRISSVRFDDETRAWKLFVYDDNDYAVKKAFFAAESPAILLAALTSHWCIENLRLLRLEVDGANQMKLL
jgi:hypothetical protein